MFLSLLCITPFKVIGAFCTERFTYPACFMIFLITEVLFFMFTTKLYLNDYYLDELRVSELDNIEEVSAMLPLNSSEYPDSAELPKKNSLDARKLHSNSQILKQMMTRFHIFNCVMMFFIVTLLVSAFLLNNHDLVDFLECDGLSHWKSNYMTGKLFSTFHVILILMGTIQAERTFYTIPHKMGYFESNKL